MAKGVKNSNEEKRNTFKEVPCIIGIDQSYTRTGIALAINGKVIKTFSLDFKRINAKTNKRLETQKALNKILDKCLKKYSSNQIVVIVERIRTYTNSLDLRPPVIKAQAALMAYIVDTAFVRGVKTYSVDTRCWKSRILGSSKPIFEPIEGVTNPQKFGSVRKAIELGFNEEISVYRNGTRTSYNDDMADAICIALYGFSGYPYQLQLEQ